MKHGRTRWCTHLRPRLAAELKMEVGRVLICLGAAPNGDSLNAVLEQTMDREDASICMWLREAFATLGHDYPEWTVVEELDLAAFAQRLTPVERQAGRRGLALVVALQNPRWTCPLRGPATCPPRLFLMGAAWGRRPVREERERANRKEPRP